jgi:hypothetical protein
LPNFNKAQEYKMESITLSTALVNQIMSYLGTRPYQDVFQLIAAVQEEAKAQAELAIKTDSVTKQ